MSNKMGVTKTDLSEVEFYKYLFFGFFSRFPEKLSEI